MAEHALVHRNEHVISIGTQQSIGWSTLVLGVLVALNQFFSWAPGLQYLWAALVVIAGIWTLGAGK